MASSYAAISCTVTTEAVFNEFLGEGADKDVYFRDISTYAGCTGGAAAALENMRIIEDEELVNNSAVMGKYLLSGLERLKEKFNIIGDVRGKGLLLGIELVTDSKEKTPAPEQIAIKVVGMCMQRGLIIGRTNRSFKKLNNTLCLCPVMTLTTEEADFILSTLESVFSELVA